MKKMGKRLMALFVIFSSIISFLPIHMGLNGKAANAAITADISVSGTAKRQGDKITLSNGEYFTDYIYDSFKIGVDNKVTSLDKIPIGETGVIEQEIIITKIDGIDLDNLTIDQKNAKLSNLGINLVAGPYTDDNNVKKIGVTINKLPLGVNRIKYRVREKTVFNEGKLNNVTKQMEDFYTNYDEELYPGPNDSKEIVIQHATGFVQQKIPYINFVDYDDGRLTSTDNPESNKTPFVYKQTVYSQDSKSLRFIHDLPNSITDADYNISFPNGLVVDKTVANRDLIYVNGSQKDDVSIDTDSDGKQVLKGSLVELGSTMILIAIRHETNNQSAINYTYSVEIQYNGKNAVDDCTLKTAGLEKLYFDADSSVKAYIGKEFITKIEGGVLTYKGTITIDKQAEMIGMNPTIGRDSSITAFKISNHYDSGYVEPSRIVNGRTIPFVDFKKGTNNQIWLEIYEGQYGNVTSGKLPLARYVLDVKYVTNSVEKTVNFVVDPSTSYLTQPGRDKVEDTIPFDSSRRTYDLNFLNNDTNTAKIKLTSPDTTDSLGRREFIKVWGGTSTQSDDLTEITDLTKDPNGYTQFDIKTYKKIVVQAYYNQTTTETVNGVVTQVRTPYPLGEKYTFYIPKNPDQNNNTGTTKSSEASLSNMKVGNGTIRATDGTSIFSSSKTDYTVTVPKVDTISSVTVTATNSKVKGITATVAETGDEYSLISGQAFDFPLNSAGKTTIKVVVTAEDGTTTKTYNLTISNDTRSATTALKNVITDKGDFTFDPEKDPNKIRVDQAVNTLKVSPVAEDAKARITINGTKYTGAPISIDLRGTQKTDMEIKVTSEDGSSSKTYYFEIYRTDSPINNNDNNNVDDVFYDDIDDTWVDLSKYEEWGTVDGKNVYFNNKGRQVKNQWINTKGVWYYLDSKGYKATGWRKEVGGKTYFLDPNTGQVKTGWLNQNNKIYYLGLNGVMQKGWLNLNGHWYYFTPEGEMVINQSMYIDDGVYRFGTDGIMY
jgi:glucan-binding YG repeat protein